jgi:pimeloyl-ACP methyl ester carboxylesterase
VLSGDPEKTRPRISPDGQQLAYRALDPRGVGQIWVRTLGKADDVDDPKDAELIRSASPLFAADRIKIPLLIGQGQNDPRVKPQEAEQIVAAVEKNGGRAIYVLYPDEGHGLARPENDIDFNARVERFLGAELGGRVELLQGERIPGSTAVVQVIAPRKPGGVAATAPAAK